MEKYISPSFNGSSFHCPNCGVFSRQIWKTGYIQGNGFVAVKDIRFSFCDHCNEKSIWFNENMIEPSIGGVALPNPDLPEDIKQDYFEARDILNKSPRGSAALLRLAIQKLGVELGEKGSNINADIKSLVSKGLPVKIQQSLDYVRVIGNNSVHPGQIDLKDNREIAITLFTLVNLIAEVMITQPKEVEKLYNTLPQSQLESIKKRDGQNGV
ncbi:MAG: DUF4145 domain-containing protein [Ekhidna sp.]|uniref:DUF4145 domain-containing protein n=1 Tax=Ekhidna sp. TaxID=2608089 RepID=UPI0032ED5B7F